MIAAALAGLLCAQASNDAFFGAAGLVVRGGTWSRDPRSDTSLAGTLSFAWYPIERLVADDSPLGLQAYLQRVSVVQFSVFGSYAATTDPVWSSAYVTTEVMPSASLNLYLDDWLAVVAGASLARIGVSAPLQVLGASNTFLIPTFTLGPAFRTGDTQLDLLLHIAPLFTNGDSDWSHAFQGTARVETAFNRNLYLDFSLYTIAAGAGAHLGFEFHPVRELGLGAGIDYARGHIYIDTATEYTRVIVEVDGSYWFTDAFSAGLEYSPIDTVPTNSMTHRLENRLILSASKRFD